MNDQVDYLVLGSGLSSLSFSALMAGQKKSVRVLEAHELFGGYGHTFAMGDYRFNAHLHYVIGCGPDGVVTKFLKKLGLDKDVTFHKFDADGFDHAYCEGQLLRIPYGIENLQTNMLEICPNATTEIAAFIDILKAFREAAECFPRHFRQAYYALKALPSYAKLFKYRSATLQQVFDACQLPKILQTLVSGQLLDYMLPPKELSFLVWAALFNAYATKGAYYPEKHFDHVVDSLVNVIESNGSEAIANQRVVEFIMDGKRITGVYTQEVDPKTGICSGPKKAHYGKQVICNFDPKQAASMIGMDKFSRKVQRALDYDYSYSSFAFYGIVEGIDLRDYKFGDWNIWHCQEDHNEAFRAMYEENDYSKPYFAMNSKTFHSKDDSHCPKEGHQVLQMLTVANYDYWKMLKLRSIKEYNLKKREVMEHLLDEVEKHYVPNIRDHLALKVTGSPTTNERYVNAPRGGAYGVNLTPRNFQFSRKLTSHTSLKDFHFCCAASGVGGFGGTIMTGLQLYEKLTGDQL